MFTSRKKLAAEAYARGLEDAANRISLWGAEQFIASRNTAAVSERLACMSQTAEALALEILALRETAARGVV